MPCEEVFSGLKNDGLMCFRVVHKRIQVIKSIRPTPEAFIHIQLPTDTFTSRWNERMHHECRSLELMKTINE